MSRPTIHQMEALADFLEENPGIAKGVLRTALAKITTKRKWNEISTVLNALGGAQKNGRGWAKYWADKKCALKKICGQHLPSVRRTGGDAAKSLAFMTPIDQKLVTVMGGFEFAEEKSSHRVLISPIHTTNITVPDPVQYLDIKVEVPPEAVTPDCSLDNVSMLPKTETEDTIPMTGERESSPVRTFINRKRPRTRQGRQHIKNLKKFVTIEKQRVEAETVTAEALRVAAGNISSVAGAINNLAAAVTEAAQVIAQAISSNRQ